MLKNLKWKTFIVILVIGVCSYLVVSKSINRGLDIQGGTHFTIQVLTNNLNDSEKADAVDRAIAVIRNRINEIGVAETVVQRTEGDRIIVQIPGIDSEEAERIKGILKRQAHLEFKLVIDGPGKPIIENLDQKKRG